MPRIHTILQGFVDINLETDENVNTKIVNNSFTTQTIPLNPLDFPSRVAAEFEYTLPNSVEEIASDINIEFASIKLAHIEGSRLYGVTNQESDWDLSIITTDVSSYDFRESSINGIEYDIHLYTPQKFQEFLDNHNMKELEVYFHPESAKLIDNMQLSVVLNKQRLVDTVRAESDSLWSRAQSDLNNPTIEPYRGHKKIWHSLRFLIFAKQILELGEITNFASSNYLYEPIVNSQRNDFQYFVDTFGAMRDQMKAELDNYLDNGPNYTEMDILTRIVR